MVDGQRSTDDNNINGLKLFVLFTLNKATINLLNKLRVVKQVLLSKPPAADPEAIYNCPVCGSTGIRMHPVPKDYLIQWQKNQTVHNPFFIETMNLGLYACSRCYTPDRNRLYALYLKQYLDKGGKINLLDIAPDTGLSAFIKKYANVIYRSMDLLRSDVDDNLDITNMHAYHDEQFDFFICSHVLEHIPDDLKAMKELYRILKKGGKGIAMVPINLQLKETMEDSNCTDESLRWKYFFQGDHVRMYAKEDFLSRLMSVGFTVEQLGIDYFSKEVFEKNAIFPTSVLYVVSK